MSDWYLIYTKPKNEDSVCCKFANCGFDVFNPKMKERKYIRRKIQQVISPLFPCYIFVKFDLLKDYRLVKYTRGVKRVVGTGDSPIRVPLEVVDSIRVRMEEGVVIIKALSFKPGEDVVIKEGPFQGFEAIFEKEMKGAERVSILLKAIDARVIVNGAAISRH